MQKELKELFESRFGYLKDEKEKESLEIPILYQELEKFILQAESLIRKDERKKIEKEKLDELIKSVQV